jgi:hypothetical protein
MGCLGAAGGDANRIAGSHFITPLVVRSGKAKKRRENTA